MKSQLEELLNQRRGRLLGLLTVEASPADDDTPTFAGTVFAQAAGAAAAAAAPEAVAGGAAAADAAELAARAAAGDAAAALTAATAAESAAAVPLTAGQPQPPPPPVGEDVAQPPPPAFPPPPPPPLPPSVPSQATTEPADATHADSAAIGELAANHPEASTPWERDTAAVPSVDSRDTWSESGGGSTAARKRRRSADKSRWGPEPKTPTEPVLAVAGETCHGSQVTGQLVFNSQAF